LVCQTSKISGEGNATCLPIDEVAKEKGGRCKEASESEGSDLKQELRLLGTVNPTINKEVSTYKSFWLDGRDGEIAHLGQITSVSSHTKQRDL